MSDTTLVDFTDVTLACEETDDHVDHDDQWSLTMMAMMTMTTLSRDTSLSDLVISLSRGFYIPWEIGGCISQYNTE